MKKHFDKEDSNYIRRSQQGRQRLQKSPLRTRRIPADVHLGLAPSGARFGEAAGDLRRSRAKALERVVDIAAERKADLILIAGDLFETARLHGDPRLCYSACLEIDVRRKKAQDPAAAR